MQFANDIDKTGPLWKNDHILVVDDDGFLLSLIRKKLERSNFKVTTSDNVRDAHFKLGILRPDLILLDVIMPEVNGLEFASAIHASHPYQKIPIILMSRLSKQKLHEMGYSLGNAKYLAKPFDLNKLPLLINRVLKKTIH